MFGFKQIIYDQYTALFARVDRIEAVLNDVREWLEVIVDESRPSPDVIADRFLERLQERVKQKGKALSSEEMRQLVKEAAQQ